MKRRANVEMQNGGESSDKRTCLPQEAVKVNCAVAKQAPSAVVKIDAVIAPSHLPFDISQIVEVYAQPHVYVYRKSRDRKTDEVGCIYYEAGSLPRYIKIRNVPFEHSGDDHFVIGDWLYVFVFAITPPGIEIARMPLHFRGQDDASHDDGDEVCKRLPDVPFTQHPLIALRVNSAEYTIGLTLQQIIHRIRVLRVGKHLCVYVTVMPYGTALLHLLYGLVDSTDAKWADSRDEERPRWVQLVAVQVEHDHHNCYFVQKFIALSNHTVMFLLETDSPSHFWVCDIARLSERSRSEARADPLTYASSSSSSPPRVSHVYNITVMTTREDRGHSYGKLTYSRLEKDTLRGDVWRYFSDSTFGDFLFAAEFVCNKITIARYRHDVDGVDSGKVHVHVRSLDDDYEKECKDTGDDCKLVLQRDLKCRLFTIEDDYAPVWDTFAGVFYICKKNRLLCAPLDSLYSHPTLPFRRLDISSCTLI